MTTYVLYKCNLCTRTKNILRDDTRVQLSSCVITKGCGGSLLKIGETLELSQTAAAPGVTDWYPKSKSQSASVSKEIESAPHILLSTSPTGLVTLAFEASSIQANQNSEISVQLEQKRLDDIAKTSYSFVASGESVLSGRDSFGKILRFSQDAIDEQRVYIFSNGVEITNAVLTVDTVTFSNGSIPTIGSSIVVTVYREKDTITQTLDFVINSSASASVESGAWGNIRSVKYLHTTGVKSWQIYSSQSVITLPINARLRVIGVFDSTGQPLENPSKYHFLLSNNRYANVDRQRNFVVSLDKLTQDFYLTTAKSSVNEIYVDDACVAEIYPGLAIIPHSIPANSSYIVPDTFQTSAAITVDTSNSLRSGTKTIGPI